MNKNRYCVYAHRRKDNDVLFYIGKGTKDRSVSKRGRTRVWLDVVKESNGFYVDYLEDGLTEKDALALETEYLNNVQPDWQLVNSRKSSNFLDYSSINWCEFLVYDENSPSKVSRIIGDNKYKHIGHIDGSGYYSYEYRNHSYKVHRIVMILQGYNLPHGMQVNHIDYNRTNNTISNLEIVTPSENCKHKFGPIGNDPMRYIYLREGKTSSSYRTHIPIPNSNKTIKKTFQISRYGKDGALKKAVEYRDSILSGKMKSDVDNNIWYNNKTNKKFLLEIDPSAYKYKIFKVQLLEKTKSGLPKFKSFTCAKRTEIEARKLAESLHKDLYPELWI